MNPVHYSSNSGMWETPQAFFDTLDEEFHFELDVCATHENSKCAKYFTEAEDGLKQEWQGICWMNPPYGRGVKDWTKKAYESAGDGTVVVCLLPARTDTQWFHEYAMKGEIRFLKGRLTFSNHVNPAPFPSMVVIFR